MEINLFLQTLRRGWWIILLTTLIAIAASLGVSYMVEPQYQAIARFILNPTAIQTSEPDVVLRSISTINNEMVITTYAEVIKSDHTYYGALELLQLQPEDIADYTYQVTVLPSSSVIELSVEGPNPQLAAQLANSLGHEAIDYTRILNQLFDLAFLDTAVPDTIPISPQPVRDAFLAGVFGLLGGIILAVLNEQIRFSWDKFRESLRVDASTGVYHRKFFPEVVENELAQNPDGVLTVGILELSGIRDIFDTFPASGLQRIFQKVADILRKELRGNDVIGLWDEISFIVMLPNTTGMAAKRIFERISDVLSEPLDLGQFGTIDELDASIGGAESGNGITAQEIIDKAESAVDQARLDLDEPVFVREFRNS